MYETNKQIIRKPTYSVEDSKLTMSEGIYQRWTIISVSNTVERLNKHPTLYLNYLKLLVESKGMRFTVDKEPLATDCTNTSTRDREKNYKLQSILHARNIAELEFEEIGRRKKKGQTTTEENANCQRHYYNKLLALDKPKAERNI